LKLFTEAADTGDPDAQMRVAGLYSDGKAVPKNDVEAVRWYRLAAEQGNAQGQSQLGSAYELGQGVPQDYVLAHMWFNLAAANSDPWGAKWAQDMRNLIAVQMTKEQIAEAQRLAREWTPKKRPVTKQ
jgi:uncharacterized protein